VINSTHPNIDLVLSIGGELTTYLKELAYADQIGKVVIFLRAQSKQKINDFS
jgi:hypothetical protein